MQNSRRFALPMALLAGALLVLPQAYGQDAESAAGNAAHVVGTPEAINGRRPLKGDDVTLGFDNVALEKVIPFIVESTGKVVIPQKAVLGKTITVINDQPIPRNEALDLLFMALQQADVGVVETDKVISLRLIEELDRQDVPVLGPDDRVERRRDLGNMYRKVFALSNASAENVGEVLQEALPSYAKMLIDADSNQVVVLGNVAMLQRIEKLVDALDRPSAAALETETFRLRYADAELIAENIEELYAADEASRGGEDDRRAQFMRMMQQRFDRGGRGGPEEDQPATATSENLRVTANVQQNSVTVIAEPRVIEQIREQIQTEWDLAIPEEAVVPKTYDLEHSDPIKIRDLLSSLFEEVEATRNSAGSEPVGRLTGQFTFQAIEESNRLVVVAKNTEHLRIIDELIEDLDRPQTAGLPELVELKHADAEDLAEQLNALLSEEGTLAEIGRAEEGLSLEDSSESPFASDSSTSSSASQNQQQTESISFWWQRSRPSTEERSASNMVGKIRIVPIARQNALMILGPPEYHASLLKFIELLDRPGRQVLIKAVIAEITLEDATALGIRWSNSGDIFDGTSPDNRISVTGGIEATESDIFGNLFDTSVLTANIDLNLLLQALDERSGIQILSEPRIFTGDNQEAVFFDGQDVPFVTDSQTTDVGSIINSFDYRAVGIQLRVRPRITKERNVDLRVNIELSSIREGQTLFGGFIVDRRETTTQLIVGDAQTVVISGILRQQEDVINRKVPLLGDLPLIGAIFRSTTRSTTNTELVAFITPVVVESQMIEGGATDLRELEQLNEEPRRRLEELREEMMEGAPTGPVDQDLIFGFPIEDKKDKDDEEPEPTPDADEQ